MRVKNNKINYNGLTAIMQRACSTIEVAARLVQGDKYEITITSAKDGKHSANSLHYEGKAVDIRTWDMKPGTIKSTARVIADRLGGKYDVVVENNHIHIEYDPK